MPADHQSARLVELIRARARELDAQGETLKNSADAEVLAALAEGTISLEEVDDEILERCLKELGSEEVVRAITHGPNHAKESVRSLSQEEGRGDSMVADVIGLPVHRRRVGREMSWWQANSAWVAVAASIAFVSTVVMWNGKHAPDSISDPLSGLSFAFAWPSKPPIDPSTLKPWGPAKPPLSNGLPDFSKGGGTLGAGGGR